SPGQGQPADLAASRYRPLHKQSSCHLHGSPPATAPPERHPFAQEVNRLRRKFRERAGAAGLECQLPCAWCVLTLLRLPRNVRLYREKFCSRMERERRPARRCVCTEHMTRELE